MRIPNDKKCPFFVPLASYIEISDKFKDRILVKNHKREKYISHVKVIKAGDIIEIINYEKPIFYGYENFQSQGKKVVDSTKKKREDNLRRTKNNIRRIINANHTNKDIFLTLTFEEDIKNIADGKYKLKIFFEKLRLYLKNRNEKLQYLYVTEFQDKNKRGVVHFHIILFDVNYIPFVTILNMWGNGGAWINRIKDVDNVGAYITEYMNKSDFDNRFNNFDIYGRSRGLKKQEEIKKEEDVNFFINELEKKCKGDISKYITYTNNYTTEYKGNVNYTQINLRKIIRLGKIM